MIKKANMYLIILLLTLVQFVLLLFNMKADEINKNQKTEISITEVKNAKYIKEIEKELNDIKKLEVLNYSKENNKWKIKAKVVGSKEEIDKTINELDGYIIENYNMKYSNNEIFLELDLVSN